MSFSTKGSYFFQDVNDSPDYRRHPFHLGWKNILTWELYPDRSEKLKMRHALHARISLLTPRSSVTSHHCNKCVPDDP